MKNIFITGYSGFVGRHLSKHLGIIGENQIFNLNLRDEFNFDIDTGDCLIHLAGKAHDLKNVSDTDEYFSVNFELTKKIFDFFLKSQCNDFIYFSSVKAVTDKVDEILTEEHEPDPKTPYGLSKLKAEQYILTQFIPKGKRVFILRPCMIHGPGNKGNLNLFLKYIEKGIPYPFGAIDNKRSFLSIENLNFIIENLIIKTTIPGGIYNLADDEPMSTIELVKLISEVKGKRFKILNIPMGVLRFFGKIGDFLHLPLNTERLEKLSSSYVVSNLKLKNALGIKNMKVTVRDGLSKTITDINNKI